MGLERDREKIFEKVNVCFERKKIYQIAKNEYTVLVFFEETELAYFSVFRHFRRQKRISISADESKVNISDPSFVRFSPRGILKRERIVIVVFEVARRAPQVASFLGVFGVLGHGSGTNGR